MNKLEELTKYFAEWDPMDFIKELDAPEEEYALEAEEVIKRYKNTLSDIALGTMVYDVFVSLVELDYKGFKDESISRAPRIRKILSS